MTIVWLLPACGLKNRLLRLLGNDIGAGVRLAPNVVLGGGTFVIGDHSKINYANVFRNMRIVELGEESFIGVLNQISASPSYRVAGEETGILAIADRAGVINRHYLDCSGLIEVGQMSMIGGTRSILQTHELDLADNVTHAGRISIGAYCFTSTKVLILSGACLPDRSVLAAGATLPRSLAAEPGGLYAGTPATRVKDVTDWKWLTRNNVHTPVDDRTRLR